MKPSDILDVISFGEDPCAKIVTIGPDLAETLLQSSAGNRKIRSQHVSRLAAAMRAGEWRITSQGIGIDRNGKLRDGHHRLHACMESGTSFTTIIVLDIPTDAFEVIDTGIARSCADRLELPQNIADTLRLGTKYATGSQQPTVAQIRTTSSTGLLSTVTSLLEYCGAKRKYFSTAPIKLAAAITLIEGGRREFVMGQYRALCLLDFTNMTRSAQALVRQVNSGKSHANITEEALARGFRVFDEDRVDVSRIQVSATDRLAAVDRVRTVLRKLTPIPVGARALSGYAAALMARHSAPPGDDRPLMLDKKVTLTAGRTR